MDDEVKKNITIFARPTLWWQEAHEPADASAGIVFQV
jgi:hypothetical protein